MATINMKKNIITLVLTLAVISNSKGDALTELFRQIKNSDGSSMISDANFNTEADVRASTLKHTNALVYSFYYEHIELFNQLLTNGGITNLMAMVTSKNLQMPCIPSKWHVDNMIDNPVEKEAALKIRSFGLQLAKELVSKAAEMREIESYDECFDLMLVLCDLSEWCAQTEGYGNVFIAREALDIAAVGLMKITCNTNFPIEKCVLFKDRVTNKHEWMNIESRGRIFDAELGTHVFAKCKTEKDLRFTLFGGATLHMQNHKPELLLPGFEKHIVNDPIFEKHSSFFVVDQLPSNRTLAEIWDYNMNSELGGTFETLTVEKAASVLTFRSAVGFFPPPLPQSPAEDLAAFEKMKDEYAQKGVSISRLENSPGYDPLEEAFKIAWKPYYNKNADNQYVPFNAVMAYRQMIKNHFKEQIGVSPQNSK